MKYYYLLTALVISHSTQEGTQFVPPSELAKLPLPQALLYVKKMKIFTLNFTATNQAESQGWQREVSIL